MKFSKIHFGPGPNWAKVKGSNEWFCIDIDPNRATREPSGVLDFNVNFKKIPLKDNSCDAIYASHTFEHINPGVMPLVFNECFRVLKNGGCLRIIIPDPIKSIKHYLDGNKDYELFRRRAAKHRQNYKWEPTLFELMREDFVSLSGQSILGKSALAHQNSWDNETMVACLSRAGFQKNNIHTMDFKKSNVSFFDFEGSYPSEANEQQRSQYFEAIK